ncbi:hypothetical protein V5799_003175 [Amblyomma americanum]|uniref:Medium-chain acyl-CoA ligase ACSF2, mitochondrial n=1 Tax=Amblyomma americanum TaxID=6943 RepID=A0AAQ4D9P9_AMBAM
MNLCWRRRWRGQRGVTLHSRHHRRRRCRSAGSTRTIRQQRDEATTDFAMLRRCWRRATAPFALAVARTPKEQTRVRPVSRREASRLSYYHGTSQVPLLPLVAGEVVDGTADVKGDNVAVVSCHQGISKTYVQFKLDIDQLAAALVSLGLPLGSKIGVVSSNIYEWPVIQFATAKAGLVLVNVNTAYQVPEMEHCLKLVDCEALILSEKFARQDYYSMLLKIAPELEHCDPGNLKCQRLPCLKHVILLGDEAKPGTITYDELLTLPSRKDYAAVDLRASQIRFDAPVNVQFTSGTTGKPKGALLSHFNIVNNANSLGHNMGLHKQDEVICLNVPMIHCFAHWRVLKPSINTGVMAGAPCPPEIIKHTIERMNTKRLHIFYGSTECSPVVTASDPDEPMEKWIHTVGRPLDHVEVKIVDDKNNIVPAGTRGELCARGYLIFLEYYNEPDRTKEVVRDKWYHTGDEAIMTEDGHVIISGRIKDMICRGGENVYPPEVEEFLYTHPDIEEVQVVGVPDKRLGEEICAWVKLKEGKTLTKEEIKEFCDGKISYFKTPKYVLFVDSFPKTVSGKIQKFKIREESRKLLNL